MSISPAIAPGYPRDPDGRTACLRFRLSDGLRLGWCGTAHVFEDRAVAHARSLDGGRRRLNRLGGYAGGEGWMVVPLTVAKGERGA